METSQEPRHIKRYDLAFAVTIFIIINYHLDKKHPKAVLLPGNN